MSTRIRGFLNEISGQVETVYSHTSSAKFLSCVALLTGCTSLNAAPLQEVEIQDEPNHRVVFENEAIRVFDVTFAPAQASLFHRHRIDNVSVYLADAEIVSDVRGAVPPPPRRAIKTGSVAMTRASGDGYVHQVTNVGNTTFRVINFELRQSAGSGIGSVINETKGVKMVFDNDRVRAYSITLEPGQSSPPMTLAAGLRVIINGTEMEEVVAAGAQKIRISAGMPLWRESGTYRLRNLSGITASLVEVEIK